MVRPLTCTHICSSTSAGGDTAAASASAAAAAALGNAPAAEKKPQRSRKASHPKPPPPVVVPEVVDEPFQLPSAVKKAREAAVDSEAEKEKVRLMSINIDSVKQF